MKLEDKISKLEETIISDKEKHFEILRIKEEERNVLLEKLNNNMLGVVQNISEKLRKFEKNIIF